MQKIELEIEHAIPASNTDAYKAAQEKLKKLKKKHMDEFHGFLFMDNSDRSKYGTLFLSGLETQHNLGNDQ